MTLKAWPKLPRLFWGVPAIAKVKLVPPVVKVVGFKVFSWSW